MEFTQNYLECGAKQTPVDRAELQNLWSVSDFSTPLQYWEKRQLFEKNFTPSPIKHFACGAEITPENFYALERGAHSKTLKRGVNSGNFYATERTPKRRSGELSALRKKPERNKH